MASARSLKSRAAELAKKLGEDIDLSGFDREGLKELVEGFEQRLAARTPDTAEQPPVAPVAEVRPAAPAEVRPPQSTSAVTTAKVADGCAITSRRGILSEGQEVKLKDFAGDRDAQLQTMQTLLASGKLVR